MSSFSYGHGEIDEDQHRLAFALMFVAVFLATVSILIAAHTVTDRNTGREPAAPECQTLDQAIRYCIYP